MLYVCAVCFFVSLSFCVSGLYVCLLVFVYVWMIVGLSVCRYVCLSLFWFVCMLVSVAECVNVFFVFSVCLLVCVLVQSFSRWVCILVMSVCLSVSMLVCPAVFRCVSKCLFMFVFL